MTKFGIENALELLEAGQPMGRIGGPKDMAGLILFLCCPASAHLTGTVIPIDGGASLLSISSSKL
jgi:NAD(P)-dependent dehydrogenase (short-subunit alcohol dehydrogenase family)